MGFFETAEYKVLQKDKNIEVRYYKTFYVASTKTRIDPKESSGFNNVFNYISGQNQQQQKISMTVPVVTTIEDEYLITSFIVPRKHYQDIPSPSSDNVFIEEIREGKFISIRFSGSWTKSNYDKHDLQLQEYMKKHNIQLLSKRYIFRYQAPFVPSVFRRNEIVYRIETE